MQYAALVFLWWCRGWLQQIHHAQESHGEWMQRYIFRVQHISVWRASIEDAEVYGFHRACVPQGKQQGNIERLPWKRNFHVRGEIQYYRQRFWEYDCSLRGCTAIDQLHMPLRPHVGSRPSWKQGLHSCHKRQQRQCLYTPIPLFKHPWWIIWNHYGKQLSMDTGGETTKRLLFERWKK